MRISDWSSDGCSSYLSAPAATAIHEVISAFRLSAVGVPEALFDANSAVICRYSRSLSALRQRFACRQLPQPTCPGRADDALWARLLSRYEPLSAEQSW